MATRCLPRLITVLGCALLLASCWQQGGAPEAAEDNRSFTFTDLGGREISLPAPAQRIVTIPLPTAATIIAVDGGPDRLVGVSPGSIPIFRDGFIGMFFPQASGITSNITTPGGGTFTPNVEAVAALRPDLVIQSGDMGGDIVKPLENAGLRVALYSWGTEEKARQLNEMAAAVVGRPEKAAMLNAWRDKVRQAIRLRLSDSPAKTAPAAIMIGNMGGLQAWGTGTIADDAIRLVGARNVAGPLRGINAVNQEQIAAWDPEIIFLLDAGETPAMVYRDPVLSRTRAARSGRVYVTPTGASRWGTAGEDDPLYWMWMANLVDPKRFDFNMRAEISAWTADVYGRPTTDAENDRLLKIDINGSGRDYRQFSRK